ncbi:hypothetical protein [Paenibacillus silvae]|uniref:hypothetical protein n=1 Tax=Paenibacillus silvae TaxID=1325358 RepID=UPI0011B56402|nr:hypothetical protein [Paenibacillus silvae]
MTNDEIKVEEIKFDSKNYLTPPHSCVPWFIERFNIGNRIEFLYNGGLGGLFPITGELIEIDVPCIKINGYDQDWMIGDIVGIRSIGL